MTLSIAIERPRAAGIAELLRLGDEFAFSLYPPESCYLLDVGELERPGVTVFVGRNAAGSALGMAALIERRDGTAELKRMFVHEDARGQGLASALMDRLEASAAEAGVQTIQLETGPLQHAAIALYEKRGYTRIPNFGPYVGDEFSVCYAKPLTAVSAARSL